jgi:hypothetical protein
MVTATIAVIVLMLLAAIPTTVTSVPTHMPDPDGNTHGIYTTTTPPTLDGIVNVGSTWQTWAYVGSAYVATSTTPLADVYGCVEVDSGGNYINLWIGMKVLAPNYLVPTDGQWLYIDWDKDDVLDYRDHTGWDTTDGADTASGVEWCIPWGQVRVNPRDTPYQMDPADVGQCFNIFLHLEVYFPDGSSDTATFPGRPNAGPFMSTTWCVRGPAPPPPTGDGWGLRTIGFWKHQLRCALGAPGHQHVPTSNLNSYLSTIDAGTTVPELKGLNLRSALMLLELRGKHDMKDRAIQQLLAAWLNLASDGDQLVDTDGDGTADTMLSIYITYAESIITDPDTTHAQMEAVKDTLDAINNSGTE